MRLGSDQHGVASFPPLAGVDHDAGHRRPVVCAIAARVRFARRRVPRIPNTSGRLQPARPGSPGDFQEQTFWRVEKELDAARRVGGKLVNWTKPEYPQSLLQICDPPVVLFVRGGAAILSGPSLAIVGPRRPRVYGTQMADRMGRGCTGTGHREWPGPRSGRHCSSGRDGGRRARDRF
jgi:DNA recombination-mediator protein A